MILRYFIFSLLPFFLLADSARYSVDYESTIDRQSSFDPDPELLSLPRGCSDCLLYYRSGFVAAIDSSHKQARWVAYLLTRQELEKRVPRGNHFYTDLDARQVVATNEDYRQSGFDRGHLAPAADMAWSGISMKESFGFVNISPQRPGLNRGIWKKLEENLRQWAEHYDSVWVATGPVFRDDDARLRGRITIPSAFYKALLVKVHARWYAAAFLMANRASSLPVEAFCITVDSLEKVSGLDFFPLLPDSTERLAESEVIHSLWF